MSRFALLMGDSSLTGGGGEVAGKQRAGENKQKPRNNKHIISNVEFPDLFLLTVASTHSQVMSIYAAAFSFLYVSWFTASAVL